MRPVRVFRWHRAEGVTFSVKVEDCFGVFHAFGLDYAEFENGPASYSTAIVEMNDGTVRNIPVELIQFIDCKQGGTDD